MTHWIDNLTRRENPFDKLVQEINKSSAEPIELDAFCELVLQQIVTIFQPRSAGLFLKQKAAGRYHLSARIGLSVNDIQLDLKHPLPVFLDRHPQPLRAESLDVLPQFKALWETERQSLPELNAELFLPLKAGGDLVGILAVGPKHSGKKFTPAEERNLAQLSNQAALTIRLKYLTTSELRWRQEAESMQRALSEITTIVDQEEALHRTLLNIRDAVAFDTASISLLQGDHLSVAAALGYNHPDQVEGREDLASANEPFQSILASHEILLVEDTSQDARFKTYAGPAFLRNWMGVPLISRGEVIGLLALNSRKAKAFQLNPARIELVQAHANQATVIAEKTRLNQMDRQRRQMAEALENIQTEVESIQDFDQVLDFLLERIGKVIPADLTLLFLAEGGQLNLARAAIAEPFDSETTHSQLQSDLETSAYASLHYLVNDKRAVVIPDTLKDSDWNSDAIAIRSWAGIPVVSEGNVIACFTFGSLKPNTYQPDLEELLRIFSNQAALALRNFRLYQEIRQLAVQDALTGLFNQRHFLELGEREFRRARRFHHQLSVMLVEVDHFQDLVKAYGEDAANQLLRSVADLINANIRNVDIPSRYSAEVFSILLTETDRSGAEIISDRLRLLVAESPNITTAGLVKTTVSIGVALMEADTPNLTALLSHADQSLELARENGRNRVEIFPAGSQIPS